MVRPKPETRMGYLFDYHQWLRPNPLQPDVSQRGSDGG
jgi:hypothetical protein